jgi:hypothetical protein
MPKNPKKVQTNLSCKFGKEIYNYMLTSRYGIKACLGSHSIDDLNNYHDLLQLVEYYGKTDKEVTHTCDFNKLLETADIK